MNPTTLLWLIAGCLMLQPLSTDLYLASLPHLATDFSATPAAVQQTLTLFAAGFGLAQLISGPLSDRYGRRLILVLSIAGTAVGFLLLGLADPLGRALSSFVLENP
ncbi:MAG: MFS transporter, partial [Rhodocyclaceae bacterium]|nr:MFS transporter [Rhodocyclaceae bacterium]